MSNLKVELKRDFFAPNARLYRKEDGPHYFPYEWKSLLPKSATILNGPAKKEAEDAVREQKGGKQKGNGKKGQVEAEAPEAEAETSDDPTLVAALNNKG